MAITCNTCRARWRGGWLHWPDRFPHIHLDQRSQKFLFRRIKLIHEPPLVEAATGLSVSCATLVAVVKAPAGHSSRNSPPQIGQKIFYVRIPICRTLVGTVPGRESAAVPREFLNKRRLITRPITIWIASSTIEEVFRLAWPTDERCEPPSCFKNAGYSGSMMTCPRRGSAGGATGVRSHPVAKMRMRACMEVRISTAGGV